MCKTQGLLSGLRFKRSPGCFVAAWPGLGSAVARTAADKVSFCLMSLLMAAEGPVGAGFRERCVLLHSWGLKTLEMF